MFARFIIQNNLKNTSQTPEGIIYTITQKGEGNEMSFGDTVVINYTLKQLNGKIIDLSFERDGQKLIVNTWKQSAPLKISVGDNGLNTPMNEALLLLNKGAKATFIIPSKLSRTQYAAIALNHNEPVVMDVEVIDVIYQKL